MAATSSIPRAQSQTSSPLRQLGPILACSEPSSHDQCLRHRQAQRQPHTRYRRGGISEALLCTAGGLIVAALSRLNTTISPPVNRFVLNVQVAGTALVERVLYTKSHARTALEAAAPITP